jgi:uncharacterized protein YraI
MKKLTRLSMCILTVAVLALIGYTGALAQSGPARVVSVDAPDMCLRVRSGPGVSYPVVGCAAMGSRVVLTGVWSNNNWAEIDSPLRGWVSGSQIGTVVVAAVPPPVEYSVTVPPVDTYYYGPSYAYGPSWNRYYRGYAPYYRRGYGPYYGRGFYRSPGVGVHVGPRGGVAVRTGGVGVGVGPRGGVGVRVGGVGVRVGPRGGVGVRVR